MATKTAPKAKKNVTSKKKSLEEARPVKHYDKAEIVTLLKAAGMTTVDGTTKTKILDGFLNKLTNPEIQEDLAKLDGDEELSALRDKILVDLNAGTKLTTGEIPAETPVKPVKKKSAAKPSKNGSNGVGRTKVKVFDHSFTRVAHWMGYEGWSREEAKKALDALGVSGYAPASLNTCITDGKNPKYSRPADLSPAEIKQLKAVRK